MKILLLSLPLFLLPFSLFGNPCEKKISPKFKIPYSKCEDGTVSFEQPDSSPFRINWRTLYKEISTLSQYGEEQSFPREYPEREKPKKQKPGKSLPPPKKKSFWEKLSDRAGKMKNGLKEGFDDLVHYYGQIKEAEGYCGSTASSNVIYHHCGIISDPLLFGQKYFKDSAPGILPQTLLKGLEKIFQTYSSDCPQEKKWHYYYSRSQYDYLEALHRYQGQPIITLLAEEGALHYVTVVGIEGYEPEDFQRSALSSQCLITYNDYGRQKTLTCHELVKKAKNISMGYPILEMTLKPFTHFVLSPI